MQSSLPGRNGSGINSGKVCNGLQAAKGLDDFGNGFEVHALGNNLKSLDFQGLKRAHGIEKTSMPRLGMADEKDPQEIAKRLRKLRTLAGYGQHGGQTKFATDELDVDHQLLSHWEKTGQIPWPEAAKYRQLVPGVTLDYIFFGDLRGISAELARDLRK